MYTTVLPRTGIAATAMGVAFSVYRITWLAIALCVIGGTLITLTKFFPRVAVEPLPGRGRHNRWHWRVTINGLPLGGRHRR